MASINALKKASKRVRDEPVEVEAKHPFFKYITPLFSDEEKEMLRSLRVEAESYVKYASSEWIIHLYSEEETLTKSALEDGLDPYDASIEHWLAAIDLGKVLMERSILHNRAIDLALALEEHSFIQRETANHYITCAMNPFDSYKDNIVRLNEVISEFQSALNEKRSICLCKEMPCCCK